VTFPIPDCTSYTPTWRSTVGKYSLRMDQGSYLTYDQDREMEYAHAVKIKRGVTPYWSDRQWVQFRHQAGWEPYVDCESVNSNKVCEPNWHW
jgi:hypothetical protein